MQDETGTDWREHYRQALFEADSNKLQMGIEAAHQSVQRRICALWDAQPADIRELTQLAYACYFLGLLRTITEQDQRADSTIFSGFKHEERRS